MRQRFLLFVLLLVGLALTSPTLSPPVFARLAMGSAGNILSVKDGMFTFAPPPLVGTVTFTCPTTARQSNVWKCTWTWLSDASGNVSANAKQVPYGEVIRFDTDPDGTDIPTDNYDLTLLDTSGVDVLQGQGANRDTANVESVIFSAPIWHDGSRTLDITIAAAGNAKRGVLVVWFRAQ